MKTSHLVWTRAISTTHGVVGRRLANTCVWSSLCGLVFLGSATASFGQAPGWSRGQQSLAVSYNECVRRAPMALQAEGYKLDYSAGDFSVGVKGVHTAVIMCNPGQDANMWVNIVVASNGEGGGVERQRLQAQMERPNSGGDGTNSGGDGTKWVYRDGGFTDTQIFYANGTARSANNREATATWSKEGNELVVRWRNGWTNRYRWNDSGQLSGVAISSSGERHTITLTRQ